MARMATPDEVASSKGSKSAPRDRKKVQVGLLCPYGNNIPSDDPWFPEDEALRMFERGIAVRIPKAELEPEPEPEPEREEKTEDKPIRGQRRGPLRSPKTAVPGGKIDK